MLLQRGRFRGGPKSTLQDKKHSTIYRHTTTKTTGINTNIEEMGTRMNTTSENVNGDQIVLFKVDYHFAVDEFEIKLNLYVHIFSC